MSFMSTSLLSKNNGSYSFPRNLKISFLKSVLLRTIISSTAPNANKQYNAANDRKEYNKTN